MRILIVTQYFYPENFKSNDLAFELQKRNHNVSVLTGLPNYPEGKIYKNYGFFKKRKETINGVKVYRSLIVPRGNGSGIRLFINYYSFAFLASFKAFFLGLNNQYDLIIVHEPSPITQFYPALLIKKIWKTPIYFWVMDLWPETLRVAGGIKNKLVLKYYESVVTRFYNNSEKILITSKGFKGSIVSKGNFEEKVIYFPNWAEDVISTGDKRCSIPELPSGFKVMFAGNFGESQDLENILNAFLELRACKNIKLILVGDGRKIGFIRNFIDNKNLSETVFIAGKHPVEKMGGFFQQADAMLIALKKDPVFSLTVPAKLQAYMSAGKPILAMIDGECGKIINEADCGYAAQSGDYKMLSQNMLKMAKISRDELARMGRNSKVYFENNFSLKEAITKLENILGR
ncbi:glycosyltransferase family 4 protein [bacterium]|nr:glycosyltransferase family 4 protein [bacterium]